MHFEILVEGESDLQALNPIMKKMVGPLGYIHTWKIHKHKGKGNFPDDPTKPPEKKHNQLLNMLPSRLRAYGKSLDENKAVIVLVDADKDNCIELKSRLTSLLDYCDPKPTVLFRIAVEELEAWWLGDRKALLKAYPVAQDNIDVLDNYVQDSICGTWELLADAIYPGGSTKLKKIGFPANAKEKTDWAKIISPFINILRNKSPSFTQFRDGLRRLIL